MRWTDSIRLNEDFHPVSIVTDDGEEKTFRDILAEDLGEQIAEIADGGPYVGFQSDLASDWTEEDPPFYRALMVGRKSVWPEGSDLDSVFPLESAALLTGWDEVGKMTSFLKGSKLVQDDFKATMASIGEAYKALRIRLAPEMPGSISDLHALRSETQLALTTYAKRTMPYTNQMRRAVAVLYLEARKASDPDQGVEFGCLSQEEKLRAGWPHFGFVNRYWESALRGGPWLIKDSTALADWLSSYGVSQDLLRIQSEVLHDLQGNRDEIISEALPVEYRRLACGYILGKIAHGRPVAPWGVDDAAMLLPPRTDFDVGSNNTRKLFFDLYDFVKGKAARKDDPEKWSASAEGWNTKAKVFRAFLRRNENKGDESNEEAALALARRMRRFGIDCGIAGLPQPRPDSDAANNGEAFVQWVLAIGDTSRPYWE